MSGMDGDYGGSLDGLVETRPTKGEVRYPRDVFEGPSVFNGYIKEEDASVREPPIPELAPEPEDKLGIGQLKEDVKNFTLESTSGESLYDVVGVYP